MAHLNDYQIDLVENSLVGVGQADNAILTVTHAAVAERHLVAVKVDASYSSSATSGELTILFGSTIIARKHIHGAGAMDFGTLGFLNRNKNEKIEVKLAASGAGGVLGDITFTAYSTA
jgi:hypothetical protein